ncbi:helix-turn-helix domain-containing protein [Streptococcus ovis]|uniref:helix-turn-helix domain-containing protein n=1 Tax=Streptococcus ovis TaxID=82806 RepID=UPI000378E1EC|nr:helix-turn-helix transcriptional regulator [Streptococcus ovis]
MTEFIYIYNILLIVLYSITMAVSLYLATFDSKNQKEKQSLFLILSLYLLFFIFDNLILSMTEVISEFGHHYNQQYLGVPLVKTIIFLVNNFCQLWIVTSLRKEKLTILHCILVLSTFIWMLIPFMENSALRVYLYYLPNQLLLIYTGFYAKYYLTELKISALTKNILKTISYIFIIFGVLIILEDTFVIFNVDSYNILNLKIQNRNFSEDVFSIVICFFIFYYVSIAQKQNDSLSEFTQNILSSPLTVSQAKSPELLDSFCQKFHLTDREKEIFSQLLQQKHNQEIANDLYLSIGTVKTHIHNRFLKLEISKRHQIFEVYQNFQDQRK